jgi:hypothetical protein
MSAHSHSQWLSSAAQSDPALPCVAAPTSPRSLAWPEAVVIIVIVLAAVTMALTGGTTHAVLVLLGGAAMIGVAATARSVNHLAAAVGRALAAAA